MSISTEARPVAYRYRWKIDGEWTGWRVSDASQKSEHLHDLEEIPLYLAAVTPPPSPDVAGVVEMLREGAQSIDNDGTPAQVGPSSDQLCEAATLLESLSAEKGRLERELIIAREDDKISRSFLAVSDKRCDALEKALEEVVEARMPGQARRIARTALIPKEKA